MSVTEKKPKMSQIDRARAYVSRMDDAVEGSGGDAQTYRVAKKLVEFGLGSSDAATVLKEYNQRCKPPWSEDKLMRKLRCAFARTSPDPELAGTDDCPVVEFKNDGTTTYKWPSVKTEIRNKIVSTGIGLSDLSELSPVSFDLPSTCHILRTLFPGDPLICIGKNSYEFWTKRISQFGRGVEFVQFIVPSPMSKPTGKIKDPEPGGPTESAHTLDNTAARRFAVVEFDDGTSDEHAAILWHLTEFAPLVMAVHSGGKSLHGWFYVDGEDESMILRFYRYAVCLGADYHTHLKSQFVRMPDGRRSNGVRQAVHYFNPGVLV